MFGIGAQELILVLVIALLVFGPKRLPELARSLGKGMAEFRRASNDLRASLSGEPPPPTSNTIRQPPAPAQAVSPESTAAPSPEPVEAPEPAQVADASGSESGKTGG